MAVPTNREEFKAYVLRKLGAPVINIDVSDDQVDDRLDESLKYYADYHFDASEKIYYKHQITEQDKTNKYITLPENIMGVVNLFPTSNIGINSNDMFSIQYQIALNDLYTLTNTSLVPYYMMRENLALIEELLVGQKPIRYSRHKDRLFIDTKWSQFVVGNYILVECYEVIDPEVWTDVWSDRWLQNYTAAKVKYQWGSNITKFTSMSLPGGVQFNGEMILKDAEQEILKMEQEMLSSYSLPVMDFYG